LADSTKSQAAFPILRRQVLAVNRNIAITQMCQTGSDST
jgi:hypothetical protein